ncbi:unnamed protein product [Ceutorhynchus assimilis]|uniref:BRISC and BRCA1-A complex member 1 n=1 Tax=Ceutorhynchus assimilis TaxID=467358 RepID=A0A9N9MK61_9CUCU|nr:unnamed protein product [Ceutorhynchus assimilis]
MKQITNRISIMSEHIIPTEIDNADSSSQSGTGSGSSAANNDEEQSKLSNSLKNLSVQPHPRDYSAALRSRPLTASVEPSLAVPKPSDPVESDTSTPGPSNKTTKARVKPAAVSLKDEDESEFLKNFDRLERRDINAIMQEYSLPNSDTLEKIILVIDSAQDENYTPFIASNQKYTPLSMIKRAVSIMIKLKLGINPHHEFAIIVMKKNDADLLFEFSNDYKRLIDCLNRISECETEDIFDLNTVFHKLEDIPLPKPLAPGLPPPYNIRIIFFYGRSFTMPQITMNEKVEALFKNPYFFCDVLMTHEVIEASNNCQKIFNVFQNLDKKGTGYFFPVGRDARRMHKCTGRLVAHPLQRPIQKLIKN